MDTRLEAAERILVVDDIEWNRDVLARRLRALGYEVLLAEDGEQALAILACEPVSLVLLDIMMPRVDGYQVLEQMHGHERWRHLPVIVISAVDEVDSAVRCIELGAQDYVAKPFNPVLLRARVGACLERRRLYETDQRQRAQLQEWNALLETRVADQVREISSAQLGAIFAMSKLAESKDPETGAHLERMREYCRALAGHLGAQPAYADTIDARYIETLYAASPLHDIGKVGVPDRVLLKPGKLDEDEWVIMRAHTLLGGATLRAVDARHPGNAFIRMGIEIAEAHHERWDGKGYPYGLAGARIPLAARILMLGDVYDALTSRRCYKAAFTHARSREIILAERGRQFDPAVVDAFVAIEDEFIRIRREFRDDAPVPVAVGEVCD